MRIKPTWRSCRLSGIATQSQLGGLYNGDHNNFAPRIGIAWALGPTQSTVLRAGYGIFYDTDFRKYSRQRDVESAVSAGLLHFQSPVSGILSDHPDSRCSPSPRRICRRPIRKRGILDVQHQLPGKMLLDVAYVGTTGTHLPRFRQIDQAYITQAQINALTNPDIVTRMELLGIPPPAQQFLSQHIAQMPTIVRGPYFGFAQIFRSAKIR